MVLLICLAIKSKRKGQPFQVDDGGGQQGLDGDVPASSPHGAMQAMLSLGLAMDAFDLPTVSSVEFTPSRCPSPLLPSSAQQSVIAVADVNRASPHRRAQTPGAQRAVTAILRARFIEPARVVLIETLEYLAARAADEVVQGIVFEPIDRNGFMVHGQRLGRDDRLDGGLLEPL